MRYTFIPQSERAILEREYRLRVAATLCIALASAIVVGVVALFPAFLRVSVAERSLLQSIAASKASGPTDAQVIQSELSADAKLVTLLSAHRGGPRLSDAIRQIALVRSDIIISSLSIDRQGTSSVSATIQGTAPTRDELISFKDRLADLAPGASVDLPIDELAKSSDISFSIDLTAPLQ